MGAPSAGVRRLGEGGGVWRRRLAAAPRSSHHSASKNGSTQPSQALGAATVLASSVSSPWKVVSSCGDRAMVNTTPHRRLVMMDMVSAKLRIIHRR